MRVARRPLEIKAVFLRPQEPFTWASGCLLYTSSLTKEDIHTDVTEVVKAAKKLVDLIGADFIVSVGRGISKDVEGGIKLAEELAEDVYKRQP